MRKTRSSRCISSRSAWLSASRYVMMAMRCTSRRMHSLPCSARVSTRTSSYSALERRLRARVGEVPRVLHDRLDLLVHRFAHSAVGQRAASLPCASRSSTIGSRLRYSSSSSLRAIRAAHGVGHRVAHEAVGAHLEQRRAATRVRARSIASPTASRTASTSCRRLTSRVHVVRRARACRCRRWPTRARRRCPCRSGCSR